MLSKTGGASGRNTAQASPADSSQDAGLRWTGHPLVDMGTAILIAFAGRDRPEEVTMRDLEQFASYADEALFSKTIRSHASVVFTSNAPYLQPSFKEVAQRQKAYELLRSFQRDPAQWDANCSYCGRPAVHAGTDTGRAYREMIPLLTGQGVVNFFPGGQHGLWMCGTCTTALQALAIGAPSCEGRALVLVADDPRHVIPVLKGWLPEIQKRVQLSLVTGDKVESWKAPRTRLIERLIELEEQGTDAEAVTGFTIYHLSNSGQGPSIAIHTLPASVGSFVRRAQAQADFQAWRVLERRAWVDAQRKAADRDPGVEDRPFWRNRLYEDLFRLPDGAGSFIKRYFVSYQRAGIGTDAPTRRVALWELVRLFLSEVMGMEPGRIEAIRRLGDVLAEEVATYDHRLFRRVYQTTSYYTIRRLLVQTNASRIRRNEAPLIDFDGFLTVFEVGDETPRIDWRIAWDLTLIRVIDELHRRDFFKKEPEAARDLEDVGGVEDSSVAEAEDEAERLSALS